MFKSIFIATLGLFASLSIASAQNSSPTATATATPDGTPVASRLVTCENSTGKVVFSLCGISGCSATVTLGTNAPKTYRVVRTRNSDGSLTYSPRVGSKPKCSATISALKSGTRRALTVSCAPTLKNSACNIK